MTAIDTYQKVQTPTPQMERGAFQEVAQVGIAKVYSYHFIDRNLRVLAGGKVRCADDQAALLAACDLLRQHTCAGIEVWDRGRYVGQLLREIGTRSAPTALS